MTPEARGRRNSRDEVRCYCARPLYPGSTCHDARYSPGMLEQLGNWQLLTRKGIENAKDTLCRHVTIYGKCRYEDKGFYHRPFIEMPVTALQYSSLTVMEGCAFNHDPTKFSAVHQTDRFEFPESTAFILGGRS
jgi:hypothetical protein